MRLQVVLLDQERAGRFWLFPVPHMCFSVLERNGTGSVTLYRDGTLRTVLEGTFLAQFLWRSPGRMYIGTGSSGDKDKTIEMPKGSCIHDSANGTHYEGTKDEDLWVLVTGTSGHIE